MSYFTDGLAVLKSDTPKLQVALSDLKHPYVFADLSEKWVAIVLEQPDDPARPWVEKYSHEFPMLWFYDAEDHGWGYIIFHEGEEKASLEVSYELDGGFWNQIVRLLYPDVRDIYSDLDPAIATQIRELIEKSQGLRKAVEQQYLYANPDAFTIFGFDEEQIDQIREIVQPVAPRIYDPHAVDEFKKRLDLRQMDWKNYDILKRNFDEGRL
jgi:hypothetical protein